MKKKALIFGGSGFLGSHLSEFLFKNKIDVCVYDFKKRHLDKRIKFIKGNILNKSKIKKIAKNFDYVFNFAGISDIGQANINPLETINQNVIGTVNILDSIKNDKRLKRFIFASSIYAVSNQGEFYSSTKRACENLIENYSKKYGFKYSILRYGSIYGTRSNNFNAIYNFIFQGINNNLIKRKGLGNEIRNYINVRDATQITFNILAKKYENKYVNIIGQKKYKVADIIKLISKKLNVKKIIFQKKLKIKYHYEKNPYNYKIEKGIMIKPSIPIDLDTGLDEIIHEIRQKNKFFKV